MDCNDSSREVQNGKHVVGALLIIWFIDLGKVQMNCWSLLEGEIDDPRLCKAHFLLEMCAFFSSKSRYTWKSLFDMISLAKIVDDGMS